MHGNLWTRKGLILVQVVWDLDLYGFSFFHLNNKSQWQDQLFWWQLDCCHRKMGGNHKNWHKIPGRALAHRAGWASPLPDAMATALMYPDKKGCLLPHWLLSLLLQETRKNVLRRKKHEKAKVTSGDSPARYLVPIQKRRPLCKGGAQCCGPVCLYIGSQPKV